MRLAFTPSSPDFLVVVPDYHPDYGHADTTRAEVLRLIIVEGLSVKEAITKSTIKVGMSTVYKWLTSVRKEL